jgi:hypothetical protein
VHTASLIKERQDDRILLMRFEKVAAEDLYDLAGYIELDAMTPEAAAERVMARWNFNRSEMGIVAPDGAPPNHAGPEPHPHMLGPSPALPALRAPVPSPEACEVEISPPGATRSAPGSEEAADLNPRTARDDGARLRALFDENIPRCRAK